tara:strand:- start:419 stop:1324 length:906 start_codon:yes stop_codon:yes gene_type:complete
MNNNSRTEFDKFRNKYTDRIQKKIESAFNVYGDGSCNLIDPMKYSSLNGSKYIRSLLVYATGSALNLNPELLDQPAVAIELTHTYTLIHDDLPCMDDDDIRRGAPSCHIAFNESSAILAGDALQSLAFQILSHKKYDQISYETYLNWVNFFSVSIGLHGVAGGQYLDLAVNNKNVELKQLEKIYTLKTGNLIAPCIMLPYMLDKDYPKDSKEILELGLSLGVCFQIKDDLLGCTSSSETLGKTSNKDEIRNQPNYVKLLGIDEAQKKLNEQKDFFNMKLKNLSFDKTIFAEISNYIFEREF